MKRIVRQAWLSYKAHYRYISPQIFVTMMVVNPTLQLVYFALMVSFAYGTKDISPWIVGNAFVLASSNCVFIIGGLIRNERNLGTLKYVLGSPANGFKIFLTRSIFHVFDVFLRVILGFVIGVIFFEFKLFEMDLLSLLVAVLTGMLSGLGFGLLIGSVALITTEIHLFLNTCEQMIILFTGALFPLSRLPLGFQWISNAIPLRRSIEASRLLLGNDFTRFRGLILEEVFLSILLIIIGYLTFVYCHHIAKRRGTVDLY